MKLLELLLIFPSMVIASDLMDQLERSVPGGLPNDRVNVGVLSNCERFDKVKWLSNHRVIALKAYMQRN